MRRYGFATGFIDFGRDTTGNADRAAALEWLVTNGIGGYAAGTVSGILTRRWHGLLAAATEPPAGRTMMLAKLDPLVVYKGAAHDLANNRFAGGVVTAPGLPSLIRFHMEGLVPTWTWCVRDALIEQRLFMIQGENTTCVHWHFVQGTSDLRLRLNALACLRPHNQLTPGDAPGPTIEQAERGVRIEWRQGGAARGELFVQADGAVPTPGTQWWRNFDLPVEASLGYDHLDNHFHAATLDIVLAPGDATVVTASTRAQAPTDANALLEAERARSEGLLKTAEATEAPPAIQHLVLAASQFVVERAVPGASGAASKGHSIIAGYPWFADWSRDTLLSIPGLLLATGRAEIAASILRTLASFLRDGLLPNRFPAPGEEPLDNAVDAPLLFIEMVRRTWALTKDDALARDLAPAMSAIIAAYAKGTRHGIAMDPSDSLIVATEPGTQLTWMDAKVGDRVVTPRMGKPVEINALWHAALVSLAEMSSIKGGLPGVNAANLTALAAKVKSSFGRFWSPHLNCLHDTLDGPGGEDLLIRPNQLFAVALGRDLLPPLQAKAVVDRCFLDLWMPLGVRTLAPGSPGYEGRYGGPVERRDQAYHNGTAWPWLFGPLMRAHDRVHHDHDAVADFMHPFVNHLREACVGQVSEVFDAEPPHAPGGCFAQAWSVAELLSIWRICR